VSIPKYWATQRQEESGWPWLRTGAALKYTGKRSRARKRVSETDTLNVRTPEPFARLRLRTSTGQCVRDYEIMSNLTDEPLSLVHTASPGPDDDLNEIGWGAATFLIVAWFLVGPFGMIWPLS
jgi:hypothetical protein